MRLLIAALIAAGAAVCRAQDGERALGAAFAAARAAARAERVSPALRAFLETLPAGDLGRTGRIDTPLSLIFLGTRAQVESALRTAARSGGEAATSTRACAGSSSFP